LAIASLLEMLRTFAKYFFSLSLVQVCALASIAQYSALPTFAMTNDNSLGDVHVFQKRTSDNHLLISIEAIEIEEEDERSESIRTILSAQSVIQLFFGRDVHLVDGWLGMATYFAAPKHQFASSDATFSWFQVFRL